MKALLSAVAKAIEGAFLKSELHLKHLLTAVHNKPINFLQLVSAILMAISFLVALYAWFRGTPIDRLEVPLTLTGIMLILLIVSRVEGGVTVIVATIIIGSVVAGDRLLLATTALWTGRSSEDVLDIYSKLNPDEADKAPIVLPQSDPTMELEEIARRLAEKAELSSGTKIEERFALVLQQEYVEQLAEQVRELGIHRPLDELSAGGETWRRFAEAVGDIPEFQEDMVRLRSLGIATFQASEFINAELTSLGNRVFEQLNIRVSESDELPRQEVSDADDAVVSDVEIDSDTEIVFDRFSNKWFKFKVETSATISIYTRDSDTRTDPELLLYQSSNLRAEIAQNDDFQDLESRIEMILQAGEYVIEVRNLNRQQVGRTTLTIESVGSESLAE